MNTELADWNADVNHSTKHVGDLASRRKDTKYLSLTLNWLADMWISYATYSLLNCKLLTQMYTFSVASTQGTEESYLIFFPVK